MPTLRKGSSPSKRHPGASGLRLGGMAGLAGLRLPGLQEIGNMGRFFVFRVDPAAELVVKLPYIG